MSHFTQDMKMNSFQLRIFYYVVLGFDCFTSNNVYTLSNHGFLLFIVVGKPVPSMEHTFGLNGLEQ